MKEKKKKSRRYTGTLKRQNKRARDETENGKMAADSEHSLFTIGIGISHFDNIFEIVPH